MNTHFSAVSLRMDEITAHMGSMETQVSQLHRIESDMAKMRSEITGIVDVTGEIGRNVDNVDINMDGTRVNVESIATTMNAMNAEVQAMSAEMHRMAKPARTLNRLFPFP
jgi:methyl-accepting chemotaxis protein